MFILIWGSRNIEKNEGDAQGVSCDECHSISLSVVSVRMWRTLYFIPILPSGSKKYYLVCEECESCVKIKSDEISIKKLLEY